MAHPLARLPRALGAGRAEALLFSRIGSQFESEHARV